MVTAESDPELETGVIHPLRFRSSGITIKAT